MSSRGFLLSMHDDDSYDQPDLRPLSPNIIISRSDYFAATEGGKVSCHHVFCLSDSFDFDLSIFIDKV